MSPRPRPGAVLLTALLASFGIVLALGGLLATSASGASGGAVRLVVDPRQVGPDGSVEPFPGLVVSVSPADGAPGPVQVCLTPPRDGWQVRGGNWERRDRPDGTAALCRDGDRDPVEIRLDRP